jgi:hypothetical protein
MGPLCPFLGPVGDREAVIDGIVKLVLFKISERTLPLM